MIGMAVLTSPVADRSLPRPFWILWLGNVVNRSGAVVQPFLSVYLVRAQGFTLAEAGVAMTAFGVGSFFSQLVGGRLADRFGRRWALTAGLLATSAALVALGAVTGFPAVVATAFLLGLTIETYRPASQAMIADLVSPESRPRAYGLLFWGVNVGYSIAMVAGGWLFDRGAQAIFGVNAAVAAVFAVLVWRAVPESRAEPTGPGPRAVSGDRLMLAVCAVTVGTGVLFAQPFTTLPLAMADVGIDRTAFGAAMALNGVLIVLVQPLTAKWAARRDPTVLIAAGSVVAAGGFALTAFVGDGYGLAWTVAVWTAGEIVIAGSLPTIVAALAPAGLQGTYAGISGMSWSAGAIVAPAVGMALLPLGPTVLWGGVGLIGAASALGALLTGGPVRRRVKEIR